jgi:hypothetical protein
MSFINLASNLHDLGRKITGIPATARILFIYKHPSNTPKVIGIISQGIFLEQKETREGINQIWLRFPNTSENIAFFNSSNIVVPMDYNQLYDNLIFDLKKNSFAPSSLRFIKQQLNPTNVPYTGPTEPAP